MDCLSWRNPLHRRLASSDLSAWDVVDNIWPIHPNLSQLQRVVQAAELPMGLVETFIETASWPGFSHYPLLLPSYPFSMSWSYEYSLISLLHANVHRRIWSLRNSNCDSSFKRQTYSTYTLTFGFTLSLTWCTDVTQTEKQPSCEHEIRCIGWKPHTQGSRMEARRSFCSWWHCGNMVQSQTNGLPLYFLFQEK